MGASSIEFIINSKASRGDINKRFKEQVDIDRDYNGSRDGYSGDFQTVRSVDFSHLNSKVFSSYFDAHEFCLENASKWETVVAVYYYEKSQIKTMVAGWGAS